MKFIKILLVLLLITGCSKEEVIEPLTIGTPVGYKEGRVVFSRNKNIVNFVDDNHWWNADNFNRKLVMDLVEKNIAEVFNKIHIENAYPIMFPDYKKGDKILIKVDNETCATMNDEDMSNKNFVNPVLLSCLLESLTTKGNISKEDLIIYDTTKQFPTKYKEIVGDYNFVSKDKISKNHSVVLSDGNTYYFPKQLVEAKYVINLANISGDEYGLRLGITNSYHFLLDENNNNISSRTLVRDDYAIVSSNSLITDKTVLYLLDGILFTGDTGIAMYPLNCELKKVPYKNEYPCMLYASQDVVALESVIYETFKKETLFTKHNVVVNEDKTCDDYLHTLALNNIGVHEHKNELGEYEKIDLVVAY